MLKADCLAVGSLYRAVLIQRVVEYLRYNLAKSEVEITLDLFVETSVPTPLRLLHRGGLDGLNATETLTPDDQHTRRFMDLHNASAFDQVSYAEGAWNIFEPSPEGYTACSYRRLTDDLILERICGGEDAGDIPFTLWETSPIPAGRWVCRLRLCLRGASYTAQVSKGSFYICGGETLLSLIESCDLPRCTEASRAEWTALFKAFLQDYATTPSTYEVFIEGGGDAHLPNRVASQTSSVRRMFVTKAYEHNTQWFTIRRDPGFLIDGQFLIEVTMLSESPMMQIFRSCYSYVKKAPASKLAHSGHGLCN
jgi:hypothetical protein